VIEYPKVLYKGEFNPEAGGLNAMERLTVNSAKEEKDALKSGFVAAEDVESLKPDAPKGKKPAKNDDGEE